MICVAYNGGESRITPGKAVDYMLCNVSGVELYAEAEPDRLDECGTYELLREEIVAQAKDAGVRDLIKFGFDEWTMTVFSASGEETPDLCGNEDEMWSHAIRYAKMPGVKYIQLWEMDSYSVSENGDDVFRVYTKEALLEMMVLPTYATYDIVEVDEDSNTAIVDWYTEVPGVDITVRATVSLDACEFDELLGWQLLDEYECNIPSDVKIVEYIKTATAQVV